MPSDGVTAGPLQGIVVLDFTRVLSGPFCTMLLGDLGAEVLKVEHPDAGDESRHQIRYRGPEIEDYFYPMNRNKLSICLDLKTSEGLAVAYRLARQAAVVVENFSVGVAGRLKLDYDHLRRENPSIVYCSISGFGQDGPLRQARTYDTNVQAMAGLVSARSPEGDLPLIGGLFFGDLSSGLCATAAILAALYHRRHTGQGQYIDIAMLDSLLSWWLTSPNGCLGDARDGALVQGEQPAAQISRSFLAADERYVHVVLEKDDEWRRLALLLQGDRAAASPPRRAVSQTARDEMIGLLADWILGRTAFEAAQDLSRLGIPTSEVLTLAEAAESVQVQSRELLRTIEHPLAGGVRQIASPFNFSRTPSTMRLPPPRLGEHTRVILERHLSMGREEVDELVAQGAVAVLEEPPTAGV